MVEVSRQPVLVGGHLKLVFQNREYAMRNLRITTAVPFLAICGWLMLVYLGDCDWSSVSYEERNAIRGGYICWQDVFWPCPPKKPACELNYCDQPGECPEPEGEYWKQSSQYAWVIEGPDLSGYYQEWEAVQPTVCVVIKNCSVCTPDGDKLRCFAEGNGVDGPQQQQRQVDTNSTECGQS